MMKRFLLTAGEDYYPRAGTGNWIAMFETGQEAEAYVEAEGIPESFEWWEIVDLAAWQKTEHVNWYEDPVADES
jgi:hypothetical protein